MTDNVEIAKLRMWRAEQLATDLNNWFACDFHSVKEMTDVLRNVSVDGAAAQNWRFALTNISKLGVKEFIETYPRQANDAGISERIMDFVDEENDREPWLVDPIRNEFQDTIEQCYIKKIGRLDDLTVLGSTVVNDKTNYDNKWERYSIDQFVDWSRSKGSNCQVKGPVKHGKTDISLLLGQYARDDGSDITTNIFIPKLKNWQYTVKLSDLIISICNSKLKKKRTLFLLDEAGLFWARIDTIQSVPKDLAKLVLCLGKLECNLVFISHFEELVPTIIRRTSVATFEKRTLTSAFVEIRQGKFKMEPQIVTHIPRTTIPFDEDQLAFFNRDMHVPDLLEYVSQIPSSENQWKSVIEYAQSHAGESDETMEISPKQVARWLRKNAKVEPRLSYEKIARIVGVSPATVHAWVREGEKELVQLDIGKSALPTE
jgi:hypothetical protein